jgi:hypothetical protein
MITAYRADERGDVVDCEPPPFNYPQEGPYTRLLFNAIVAVVLAAIIVGLSLVGISP